MKTVFSQKQPGGQWFWHTLADNGKIVADGSEGYNRLSGAVHGFLVSQGSAPSNEDVATTQAKLVRRDELNHDNVPVLTYHLTHQIEKG